jgi:hypothetical protein
VDWGLTVRRASWRAFGLRCGFQCVMASSRPAGLHARTAVGPRAVSRLTTLLAVEKAIGN